MMFENGRPNCLSASPEAPQPSLSPDINSQLFIPYPVICLSFFFLPLAKPELVPEFGGQLCPHRCTHQMIAEGGMLC